MVDFGNRDFLLFIFFLHFFFAVWTKIVFEARLTTQLFTLGASADAILAYIFIAARVLTTAAQTHCFFALATISGAFFAVIPLAVKAIIGVFSAYNVSTVVTGLAIPIIQRNIWTVRVVTVQYASYHCEEIAQSALFEGSPDHNNTVTFAQPFVANVRVRNGFVCCCRMWIQRHYTVRARSVQFT